MGIDHVYDSRSTDFAELIRRDTDGYGVDIVLNSLTGAAQRAGFELLADGGRFVEIGKRDIYGERRLGMFPFRRNLTFHYRRPRADVGQPSATGSGELLNTVFQHVADGVLPPAGYTHYQFAEAATADPGDERGRTHRQAHPGCSAYREPATWWCRRSRLGSSAATAPT